MSAHDFTFDSIDGGAIALSSFAGKAILIVNTASECGYTPQYEGLETLWSQYRERGLVVLGVPSNDFGAQEPSDGAAILAFCQSRYQVNFPLTAKQSVIGGAAHPFYRWVVAEIGEVAAPKWNFHKYLLSPDGGLAGLWPSDVEPLDPEITNAIESVLDEA